MNDLMSAGLATRLTVAHLTSARPGAPVVPDHPRTRAARTAALRALVATELRAVARWIEPRAACRPTGSLG
jgi:hypothetical protein